MRESIVIVVVFVYLGLLLMLMLMLMFIWILLVLMFIWILLMLILINEMILVNVRIVFNRVDINGGVTLILSSLILSPPILDTLRSTLDDIVIW